MGRKYSFNNHYFDVIDSEDKAYWLGFIWSDGYLAIRDRGNNGKFSYEFKLSLKYTDYQHLQKFNECLDGNYPIKIYNYKSSFGDGKESRLLICNKYFGEVLSQKYGLIPRRSDCSKLLSQIPKELTKHFIRGTLDADGTFLHYNIEDNGNICNKYTLLFGGQSELLRYIECDFVNCGFVADIKRKLQKRHPDRDATYETLTFSGKNNVVTLLNYLYKDATIYLDRKYDKYLKLIEGGENNCNTN